MSAPFQEERIRLLEFITSFHIGGTEKQFAALVRGLDPARFDLHLGCLRRVGDFLPALEELRAPITEYGSSSMLSVQALRMNLRLASYLRSRRIELVHSHGLYPNTFVIPAARLAGVPAIVASIRDMGEWWSAQQQRAQRIVCRLADRILVNAEAVKVWLASIGYDASRITVIPNGIDTSAFDAPREPGLFRAEMGIAPGHSIVGVFSRMTQVAGVELKGISHFVESAALIAKERDDVTFVVVGDGGCRPGLERRTRELGLEKRILFTGFRMDIPQILFEVAVAVSPSTAEALSNSVLESMAAGAPLVATRVGGTPEAVDDGVSGILVPPADPAALAAAIRRLLDDRDLAARLGRAARERVRERFSMERMVASTQRLYVDLLESANRRTRSGRFRLPRLRSVHMKASY